MFSTTLRVVVYPYRSILLDYLYWSNTLIDIFNKRNIDISIMTSN
jgi:hypothetical protein